LAVAHGEQNAMESVLTRSPSTPTRAKSAGPSSPYTDRMDDTDSSGTRKRPRLDSGERTYRSMSADRLKTTPSEHGISDTVSTQTHAHPPSGSATAISPVGLTPTKVTINVREPVVASSPPLPSPQATNDPAQSVEAQQFSSPVNQESPKVVSVQSSPMHSPEIEVAEIEDMSDGPSLTRWRPLGGTSRLEARQIQLELLSNFPLVDRCRSVPKALSEIAKQLEKSKHFSPRLSCVTDTGVDDLAEGNLLEEVATWIESFLETTEPLASHWWYMFADQRIFWEELPVMISSLFHRR